MWDAAFGLFPAAGELADNGFNLQALLHQSTFHEGGPNCHAESVVTWITAVVLAIFGKGQTAFAVLHLLTFMATAWILSQLHTFLVDCYGKRIAWLTCLVLLACPLFSVQAGAMYFEIPLAACAVSSAIAYSRGHLKRAICWSVLAVLVKQAGVVVPAALIAAVLLSRDSIQKRLALVVAIAVPVAIAVLAPLVGTHVLASYSKPPAFGSWWQFMSHQHLPYLKAIPDVVVGYLLVMILGLLMVRSNWRALRGHDSDKEAALAADVTVDADAAPAERTPAKQDGSLLFGAGTLQLLAFTGFFFVVPFVARLEVYCLPRYFVFVLPMVLFGLAHCAMLLSRRLAMTALMMTLVWFVVNRDGGWYPAMQPNNGAIAERAESCRWLVENQRVVVQAASRLPADSLVLYGLPEHYFLTHPWMGYSTRMHPGGRCIMFPTERPTSLNVADLPDQFYVIIDSVILGGRDLRAVVRDAGQDPRREVRVIDESGRSPFGVKLYEVRRKPDLQVSR
jgi:hypothetical protein